MGKNFGKEALILLVLVFLIGAALAGHSMKQRKTIDEIIAITDSRTEYLFNMVQDLSKRVEKLEKIR